MKYCFHANHDSFFIFNFIKYNEKFLEIEESKRKEMKVKNNRPKHIQAT